MDYVANFLIGPREGSPNDTLPGDSGTLWCLEDGLRPIAMQWGAHVFVDAASIARGYALATSLSLICRELDVDVLRGHNTGLPPYWGDYRSLLNRCQGMSAVGGWNRSAK